MVSVYISLTPSLPGATLSLSGSQNKRVLGNFMGLFFLEGFASDRRKASRASANQNVAGTLYIFAKLYIQQVGKPSAMAAIANL